LIPKWYKDTESDFEPYKPTVAKILISYEQAFESISIYACKSGARVGELSSILWKEVDLDTNPVSIHLRAETTKTKVGNNVNNFAGIVITTRITTKDVSTSQRNI